MKTHQKYNTEYSNKVSYLHNKKSEVDKNFYRETKAMIDELMDSKQRTVAWMLYYSMKNSYPFDLVGLGIELWCNYCEDIDPLIDDEGKYAASIELFVSKFLENSPFTKLEILHKYSLHHKYDPISLNI